jgi:diguanylate cyclase (GGDEF)-like protein
MNMVEDPQYDILCENCRNVQLFPYLCVQLVTRNEPLGLLHLQYSADVSDEALVHWQRLAMMVADHLALALSNLRLREQLQQRAIHDPLTGLFNRYYLDDTLDRELSRAEREQYEVGFMILDIDYFKHYNDTYGHDAGDTVLKTFGNLLKQSVRHADIACRFGGEEFLIVLPGASLSETHQRANALCDAVHRMRIVQNGQELGTITISVGVACFPQHGTHATSIISAADQALYRAKAAGRNRVTVAEGAQEHPGNS